MAKAMTDEVLPQYRYTSSVSPSDCHLLLKEKASDVSII